MYSIDINAGKQKICEIPLLTTKKLKHSPSVQIKNSTEAYTGEFVFIIDLENVFGQWAGSDMSKMNIKNTRNICHISFKLKLNTTERLLLTRP